MSYGIIPYTLKTEEIHDLFMKFPVETYEQICENISFRLKNLNEELEEVVTEEDTIDTKMALQQIITKAYTVEDGEGVVHCYVLELLCKYLGKMLPNEYFYPFGSIDQIDFLMNYMGNPFEIPSSDDFPVIYTIPQDELFKVLFMVDESELSQEQKEQFEHWIKTAKLEESDLILFYY